MGKQYEGIEGKASTWLRAHTVSVPAIKKLKTMKIRPQTEVPTGEEVNIYDGMSDIATVKGNAPLSMRTVFGKVIVY